MAKRTPLIVGGVVLLGVFILYVSTAAASIVPGDPTEYTFVGYVLGIAHPPGYAFMTLLTKLWQTLAPVGSVAQRSHWLASAAGALTVLAVLGAVWQVSGRDKRPTWLPPLFAALSLAVAADFWQHSIHINSHIVTVTLNALAVFLLLRWWRSVRDQDDGQLRWLYAFCVVAGIGPTHHPLTVFSYPAYFVFIVLVRPDIVSFWQRDWWRKGNWRIPLTMLGFGLLGLAVWLYYPIRSPMEPVFGPHDMNTLDGFLNVALARGLRVNLFHFGLADQGQRLLVFWTLLRQQFALPVMALALVGLVAVARRHWRVAVFVGLMLLLNLAFTINTVQDVMAYLLTPFMLIAVLAGLGAWGLWQRLDRPAARRWLAPLWALSLLIWPALGLAQNLPRIGLQEYRAGDEYVAAVEERFAGHSEGATLLNDWEHQTPLWYAEYVEGVQFDPADVTPSLVSTDHPWLERVFQHLPAGPVYLSGYRREIVEAGFRLRPEGDFYQVVEPGDTSVPDMTPLPALEDQPVDLMGYTLGRRDYLAGDLLSLDLVMQTPVTTTDYLVPTVRVGDLEYAFTTDSHLLTPWWLAGEVIVERFTLALPLDLAAGSYPLQVGLSNLRDGTRSAALSLGKIAVAANPAAPNPAVLDDLLANFGQRVGVDRVTVRADGGRREAVWDEPLAVTAGDPLNLVIHWRCLAPIEESYTVFVHLIDANNQVWTQQDYTPLGGSNPTNLWIPKWLPGQTALDPYRLQVPAGTPPGDYYLEIGLYGMTTRQRIYQYDRQGNLVGDRLVLGPIQVR